MFLANKIDPGKHCLTFRVIMKAKKTHLSKAAQNNPSRNGNGIVNALIIPNYDLSLVIRLQNIVNFLLENMNAILTYENKNDKFVTHMSTSTGHLRQILNDKHNVLSDDITRILQEMIDECDHFLNFLKAFPLDISKGENMPDAIIVAKASQIQWLGVCALEELKKTLSKR